MKTLGVIALLLTTANAALAQDEPQTKQPDYSRETLIRIFSNEPEREKVEARVRYSFGAIDFRAFGMRWRVGYLPFFMPFPGSMPWVNGQRWPDPFLLTGTEFATTPRTFRQQRNMNAELKRIEKKVREAQKVKVQPE